MFKICWTIFVPFWQDVLAYLKGYLVNVENHLIVICPYMNLVKVRTMDQFFQLANNRYVKLKEREAL